MSELTVCIIQVVFSFIAYMLLNMGYCMSVEKLLGIDVPDPSAPPLVSADNIQQLALYMPTRFLREAVK